MAHGFDPWRTSSSDARQMNSAVSSCISPQADNDDRGTEGIEKCQLSYERAGLGA